MAGGAVPLGVTGGAGFQLLSGRLSMAYQERAIAIMIPGGAQPSRRSEPSLLVAALAELCRVMTVTAVPVARIGRGGMARQEALGMEPRPAPGRRPVTSEAVRPHVAGFAARGARGGIGPMSIGELRGMTRRCRAGGLRSRSSAGAG